MNEATGEGYVVQFDVGAGALAHVRRWYDLDIGTGALPTAEAAFAAIDSRFAVLGHKRSAYRVTLDGRVIEPKPRAGVICAYYPEGVPKKPGLPATDAERKGYPVFRGPLMYFPDAFLALAHVCKVGNDQHNPGEPLHWAREKSTEQMDTALRHMMDHGLGNTRDTDGTWHLAKAVWRLLAELQLAIEGPK